MPDARVDLACLLCMSSSPWSPTAARSKLCAANHLLCLPTLLQPRCWQRAFRGLQTSKNLGACQAPACRAHRLLARSSPLHTRHELCLIQPTTCAVSPLERAGQLVQRKFGRTAGRLQQPVCLPRGSAPVRRELQQRAHPQDWGLGVSCCGPAGRTPGPATGIVGMRCPRLHFGRFACSDQVIVLGLAQVNCGAALCRLSV